MATVQVSTLEEFFTAIAVQGDTVVCPEGAVWDANDVYPDGYTGNIPWRANAQGNGTTIKNLRFYGYFYTNESAKAAISDMRIIDVIGSRVDSTSSFKGLFWGNYDMSDCTITAVLNSAYNYLVRNRDDYVGYASTILRCSVNVDASGNFNVFYAGKAKYSRIEAHLPNSTWSGIGGSFKHEDCEIIMYAPNNASSIRSLNITGSIVHGNLPLVQEASTSGSWQGDMTVYSTDAMPSFSPRDSAHFVGVTDAQLRDPSYLRGIGFPIAIEV